MGANDGTIGAVRVKETFTSGLPGFLQTLNYYSENLVTENLETPLYIFQATGNTYKLLEVMLWGDYDCEMKILVDGIPRGGGRTSPTERCKTFSWIAAPIVIEPNSQLEIVVQHYSNEPKILKCSTMMCVGIQPT